MGRGLRSVGWSANDGGAFVGQSRSNETGLDEEFPEDLES